MKTQDDFIKVNSAYIISLLEKKTILDMIEKSLLEIENVRSVVKALTKNAAQIADTKQILGMVKEDDIQLRSYCYLCLSKVNLSCIISLLKKKTVLDMTENSSLEVNLSDIISLLKKKTVLDMTENSSLEVIFEAVSKRSKYDSTDSRFIKLYRNVIENETFRMMTDIDIVVSETKHWLGEEKSGIVFDLLDDEFFHFESEGAVSDFVPNMSESAVRRHVVSFFVHASDIKNRLKTLFISCPNSQKLQQMPEPTFISLFQYVIVSFLSNNKTKSGKSDKAIKKIRLVMVAPRLFVIADGGEIPEDILVRFRYGDKTVMNRFVDAGLEIMQASKIQDNRPIHSRYFPHDCRLFIYIPTENGSYWHKKDMQRDNRIRRHGK